MESAAATATDHTTILRSRASIRPLRSRPSLRWSNERRADRHRRRARLRQDFRRMAFTTQPRGLYGVPCHVAAASVPRERGGKARRISSLDVTATHSTNAAYAYEQCVGVLLACEWTRIWRSFGTRLA